MQGTVFGNDEEDNIFDDFPSRSDYLSAIEVIKKYFKNVYVLENFILSLNLITDEYLEQNPKAKTQKSILDYFKFAILIICMYMYLQFKIFIHNKINIFRFSLTQTNVILTKGKEIRLTRNLA